MITPLPTLGSPLHGGTFAGITTAADGTHHALILLDTEPATKLKWRDALAWAAELSADLPTRTEQSMLFANLKSEFKAAWYWSSEQHASNSDCAWSQLFVYGGQNTNLKSAELRARAVRRLPIHSFGLKDAK